ncbi:AI-2E family transporter [Mariniflexile maritimum]|jgi:predicted PurR-regulated permease PerM|uniref:AI-2E family transporter n=1 Tax=Mariniflexile maritimum TaxID=2682493 RepID=UPI0012F6C892|nr:AI-2E family transporter [Mariniflexile maritimum]MCB0448648.1 AI-2E family transporter [Confluentibacter sp.]HMQ43221.1 AI-2E family transporter [Mariniflexile sp.]HMR15640.1 AI-2E family transporter [Mariniflexile sp.]
MTIKNTGNHSALNLISLIAVVFILYVLKPFIVPLLFAVILSVMVFPLQSFLENKWRFNRLFATITSVITLLVLTALVFFLISVQFANFMGNSADYSQKLSELFHASVNSLEDTLHIRNNQLFSQKEFQMENIIKDNLDKIVMVLSESTSFLSNLILVPICLFFFLYYRKFFRTFIYKLYKTKSKSFLNAILKKIYLVQQNYLVGLLIVIVIVGFLNSIGLLVLGIGNPFFFGFLAALLLLIPYIGIAIGSLLPALIALATKDSPWYAVGVIGVFAFIQFLEGNFITPKITGSKVSVNAFVVIISLILFSMLWGIAGMILALPITATLKIIFDNTPGYEAYGFLIGEPVDKHFQTRARLRLKKWKNIRNAK